MILDRRLVRTAPVLDFPLWEYEVDENGNVWSFKRREYGMRLEPCRENSSRRPRVSLSRRGEKPRNYYVHVIVCTGFHGPAPSPYHQVHHLDQDTTNNEAGNLSPGWSFSSTAGYTGVAEPAGGLQTTSSGDERDQSKA